MNKYDVMNLDPNDMPAFLNELASEYFEDNFDIRMQLSQCSLYIHTMNAFLDKEKPSDESCWVMQPGKTASIPPYYIWKCKYCGRAAFTEKPIAPDVSCPNCVIGKQPEAPEKASLDCWENNPILLTSNPPKLLWKCKYCGKEITTGVSEVPTTICSCLEKNKVIPEAKFVDVDMQMRIIKGDMQYLSEKVDKLASLIEEQKMKRND